MHLLTADTRPEVAVHELDDRERVQQRLFQREVVHIVGEADVGGPCADRGEDALPAIAEHERLELSVDGAHFRPAAVGAMDDRNGVSSGGEAGQHAVEIALNAANIAEPVVHDENPHQRGTSLTTIPSTLQGSSDVERLHFQSLALEL